MIMCHTNLYAGVGKHWIGHNILVTWSTLHVAYVNLSARVTFGATLPIGSVCVRNSNTKNNEQPNLIRFISYQR